MRKQLASMKFHAGAGLFFALLLSNPAQAGGYFLPGGGVRAMSRGGAYVVGTDDANALYLNPANLATQKGTQLHLEAAGIFPHLEFTRAALPDATESFEPVNNAATVNPGATIGISSDFGLPDLVFALGFYTPYGSWSQYPDDGAQRYSAVRMEDMAYTVAAALAWQPTTGLRLGASMTLFTLRINESNAVSVFPGVFGEAEDRDLDGTIQMVAEDAWQLGAVGGLWLHPGAWLPALTGFELGFSVVPGCQIQADGKMRVRLPDHILYDDVTVDPAEPPITVSLDLPWILRGGIRYLDPKDRFDVEFNLIWEGWSSLDRVKFKTKENAYYQNIPAIGDFLLTTPDLERNFKDTLSLRLGGSLKILPWLRLRAGTLYESGAPPDAYYSVATPDSTKIGAALGLGLHFGAYQIDLGYLHLFLFSRDIASEDSLARQVNPSNPEGTTLVGGGKYQSSVDLLGLSFKVRLDRFWSDAPDLL